MASVHEVQCQDIGIVRVVVVLLLVVSAFVPHQWHITLRVAGCIPLQGEAHSLMKNGKTNPMIIFGHRRGPWACPGRENEAIKNHALENYQKL